MGLLDTLRRTVAAHDPPLIEPGDRVLVAVSGGPDSLSLLHALLKLRDELRITLRVAHIDHGFRGEESRAEAEFVRQFCEERQVACFVRAMKLAWLKDSVHGSKQEIARSFRYDVLGTVAEAYKANKIATGHTRDDRIETVLLNILRGTGIDGLAGIPVRRGTIIRPLMDVSRAEVEAYCAEHGLAPRHDPSNSDPGAYTRNRIRLELLPLLERDYARGVKEALLRLSDIADAEQDFMRGEAERALAAATIAESPLRLDRAALAALHPALLRATIRLTLMRARQSLEGVTFTHVEQIRAAIVGSWPLPFSISTHAPCCFVRVEERQVIVTIRVEELSQPPLSVPLTVPSVTAIEPLGLSVAAEIAAEAILPPGKPAIPIAVMDADRVDLASLVVRTWQFGDRIDPLGMGGRTKKLQDIFMDAKVPKGERRRVPIIADPNGIVWVAGHAVSERAKVTQGTTRRLRLTIVNFDA
jgi:tRNA(Ile)-lysidine synthase